jgi:hypothetical protein
VPFVLGIAAYELTKARLPDALPSLLRGAALPAAIVVAVAAGAFVVQEQYAVADGGAFYERTNDDAVFPWTDGSITIGGFTEGDLHSARPDDEALDLIAYLEETVPEGSVVLVPGQIRDLLPGMLPSLLPLDDRGAPQFTERRELAGAYYEGTISGQDLQAALAAFDVDYVVTREGHPSEFALRIIGVYIGRDFVPNAPSPEQVIVDPETPVPLWAYDPDREERLNGEQSIVVPLSIDPDDRTLSYRLYLAPAEDVSETAVARFAVSYFEVPRPEEGGNVVTLIFDVRLRQGDKANEPVLVSRAPPRRIKPGASYAIVVTRFANAPEDTYDGDVLLGALEVLYAPDFQRVPGTSFEVLDLKP